MAVKCPDCGLIYVPEEPDDVTYHANRHKDFMAPDHPVPDTRISALADPVSGVLIVQPRDPNFLHEKLYGISRRFKREMKTDQIAWAERGSQLEPGSIGVLFCDQDGRTLGGAGVYTRTPYRNVSHLIGWIWIAPDHRRQGVLSRALPDLAKRFPGALFEFPYSETMLRFAQNSPYITGQGGPLYLNGPV